MNRILAPILLLVFLFPALALSEEVVEWDDLVEREGIYYKKFTTVPFTGKVTGQMLQGQFKNGKEEGSRVWYHDNGQLFGKGDYKNGKREGPWVTYHDNGQLGRKGTYKDGKKEGPWISYWDNGLLMYKGVYKDWKREGPWVSYNKDGTVNEEHTGTYKNDVKVD